MSDSGITNYSIFLLDGLLFSYFEFAGDNYEDAMSKLANNEASREWWARTNPCQQSVESAQIGEWWAPTEQIFHMD